MAIFPRNPYKRDDAMYPPDDPRNTMYFVCAVVVVLIVVTAIRQLAY